MNPLRVLIIEDDPDIIDLVTSVLEPAYECYSAGNGMDGLQKALQGEPDMVICDIMMPVMDGHEFIRRLRKFPTFEHVPVIFLSALSSQQHIRDGYQTGASLYLTKPINPQRLRRNIDLFAEDHGIYPRPKAVSLRVLRSMEKPHLAPQPDVFDAPRPTDFVMPGRQDPFPSPEPPAASRAVPVDSKTVVRPDKLHMGGGQPKADEPSGRVRVLIVEDDADSCQMIRVGLVDRFEVLEAKDGIIAIEQAVRYKPDLFIIDGMLPRMTGYQLVVMLKKNRTFYKSPIIFISGKANQRDQQYVERLGINRFLAKPFTIRQLIDIVDEMTAAPDFTIQKDRISFKQIYLEQFQHMETHRPNRAPNVDQIERMSLDKLMKKQLK